MKKSTYKKNGRITGAILSSLLFGWLFLFLIFIITFLQFSEGEQMPVLMYLFVMTTLLIPTVGIGISLYFRIKEIKSGEEDEAKKALLKRKTDALQILKGH